jgi:hypothetical protein
VIDAAKKLTALGLRVFPLLEGTKKPAIRQFATNATLDVAALADILAPGDGIGISTNGLVAIDVDNKDGKDGDGEIFKLELEGCTFPPTFEQTTPTGGRHLIYRARRPFRNSVGALAPGLDIRSDGGYLVGAGTKVKAGVYTANYAPVADAPEWLYSKLPGKKKKTELSESATIDQQVPLQRGVRYLDDAPVSVEGRGGDQTAFRVSCQLKDLGLSEANAFFLLQEFWNPRCEPPWSDEDLRQKVKNAYAYGTEPVGAAAPETQFAPLQANPICPVSTNEASQSRHPFEKLNSEYAFVLAGGGHHILRERTQDGKFHLDHLNELSFHKKFAAQTMMIEGEAKPITTLWMKSPMRRSYDGFCFRPGKPTPEGYYNLFRGFAVEPAPQGADLHPAVRAFLGHARENVCHGDPLLFDWLMGYFSHLFQKPWEKPLVSLVFRGGKGTGKTSLVERVGYLLGSHFLLTANRRYLVGNFNGHLENLLLFTLEEAFWSGDKQAEGTLKDLITGSHHVIEHKGKEPYTVENCTRIVIIGNEDWLVPATQDERRFAVFDVGNGRKQDGSFFQSMREGMEQGGYRSLLRYFLDFDLSTVNVNEAPKTKGLLDQKLRSLEPFHQWWLERLTESSPEEWKTEVAKAEIRDGFLHYLRTRQIRTRVPDERAVGKQLLQCCSSTKPTRKREGVERVYVYTFPPLEQARKEWEAFIGHPVEWH